MMRKSAQKISHKKTTKRINKKQHKALYGYIIIAVGVFLLIILGKYIFTQTKVLGQSTVLLARGGDNTGGSGGGDDHGGSSGGSNSGGGGNSGGSSGGSDSSSGSSGSSGGSNNGGSNNDSGRDTSGNKGSQSGSTSITSTNPETTVDCIGPDGKHFTTTFKSCNDLNSAWGKKNWTFNSVTPVPHIEAQETPKPEKLEVKIEDKQSNINIESNNTEVKLEISDDKLKIKTKDDQGNEVELEQKDALKKVNEALENEGVEIEHATESGNFHIKNGNITAKTELPIVVDPSTNTLSVTTPGGTKEIAVLPNAAVESLLTTNILDKKNNDIELVNINNDPTFKITGTDDKKFFGFIPVNLQKTVFVSASTGNLVKIEESPFNRLIDLLSR